VHADQEPFGVETVHLGQRLAQATGAVDDDRDEVVVVLDLRTLVELLDVLHRERVDLEDLVQQGEHVVVGALQVQPEQPVGFRASSMLGRVSSSSRQFVSSRCPRTASMVPKPHAAVS
jgi:hypothetical protein